MYYGTDETETTDQPEESDLNGSNQYHKVNKIGCGTYGSVYLGKDVKTNKMVAIKRNFVDTCTDFIGTIREFDLLLKLRGHPCVVNLLSITFTNPFTNPTLSPISNQYLKDDFLYFIFESAMGDLSQALTNLVLPYSTIKKMMVQILVGIEYIHKQGIIHLDMKPENLLIFDRDRIKICDFGMSKPYCSQDIQVPNVVTCLYRSPEICLGYNKYDYKVDIWSIGCIFYEMISGSSFINIQTNKNYTLLRKIMEKLPYNVPNSTILKYKGNDILKIPKVKNLNIPWKQQIGLSPTNISKFNLTDGKYDQFLDLLSHMLEFDCDKRFTASQCLQHPMFKGYQRFLINDHFPTPSPHIIKVVDCIERTWILNFCKMILNQHQQKNIIWYEHRILFQAIDLFDRLMGNMVDVEERNSILNQYNINKIKKKDFNPDGTYINLYNAISIFLSCLYVSLKYFGVMKLPFSIIEIIPKQFNSDDILEFINIFEYKLVFEILEGEIYRRTLYEESVCYNITLTDQHVHKLLSFYKDVSNFNRTGYDIFGLFLKSLKIDD